MKTRDVKRILILLLLGSLIPNLSHAQISENLEQFVTWISGSFALSTEAKTGAHSLCASRIWEDKANGAWVYLEHQPADSTNKLIQSIYFVSEITEDEFSLDRYDLKVPDPQRGSCEKPELFVGLTPFDLYYKKGCTIFINYDGFQYAGVSNAGHCVNKSNEIGYIVTDFVLTVNDLTILDKRYNQDDEETELEEKIYTKNN